jgi:hypothetical protein
VITTAWRTKLTLLAVIPLAGTGLMLALTTGATATTSTKTRPVPHASPAAAPTLPAAAKATLPAAASEHGPAASGQAPSTVSGQAGSAARPGDNGTVKIHNSTTAVTDPRNEPHVCVFYLDAFGFDPAQSVSWKIESWPPTGDRTVVASGTLTLDSNGDGHTGDISTLQSGHYKLFWNFTGEKGFAKQKVFWVTCESTPPPTSTPTPTPSESTPAAGGLAGQLPITGWPLALTGAVALGLIGTGTGAILASRRRRGLHID